MNINRLAKKVSNVPEIRLFSGKGTRRKEIPFAELLNTDVIASVWEECRKDKAEQSFLAFYMMIADVFFYADDIQNFIAAFACMIRYSRYRALLCAKFWGMERNIKVSANVNLQYAMEKLRLDGDEIEECADAIASLGDGATGILCEKDSDFSSKKVSLRERVVQIRKLHDRILDVEKPFPDTVEASVTESAAEIIRQETNVPAFVADADVSMASQKNDGDFQTEAPKAETSGGIPESIEDKIRKSIGEVKVLPNRQKLVEVKTGSRVHYIVVDEDVDIYRAPKIYDMVCRDKLHLSFNVTTDRLERCWQVEKLLDEGWRQCEIAELLGIPAGIVNADVAMLRRMGRDIKKTSRNRG